MNSETLSVGPVQGSTQSTMQSNQQNNSQSHMQRKMYRNTQTNSARLSMREVGVQQTRARTAAHRRVLAAALFSMAALTLSALPEHASVVSNVISNVVSSVISSAHAQSANEGAVPAAFASQLPQGRKLGEGTMRWFGLKLYDAQLWTEKPAAQFNHRNDRHLLELRYDKSFDGVKIAEASREQIEGQGVGNAQLWAVWQKKLTDIIPDVQKDTRLAALYLPGKGMQLFRDGQLHAELNDPELAAAFMGIWLDTRTSEPKLRERLLGLRK